MKYRNKVQKSGKNKPVPLWKWLVIIFLVVAMPLFFSFYRDAQIQQALVQSTPATQQVATMPDPS